MPLKKFRLIIGCLLYLTFFPIKSFSQNVSIIDVRKNIPKFPKDPVYKDYYINGGSDVGLKRGMSVTVVRRVSVHDSFQNKSQGELFVPVGKVKLVQVQSNVSVARLVTLFSRESLPYLEIESVISGDRLDISSAEDETHKSYKLEARAGNEPEEASPKKENPLPPSANDGSLVQIPTKVPGEKQSDEQSRGPGLY